MERIARCCGDLVNRIFILTVLALSGCDGPRTSLVERADPAERVRLELSGAAHDALALPFPAERRFEVDLPSAAFLRVSPALVTEQNVRRARVSFRVMVETENDSVEVFDEVFRFGEALLHGPEQIADLPVPVAESPGAVRIGHPERSHLVEYLAPNSVFNSLPRQRSSPHLRPDDRLVTIDRVLHHASLGVA